MMLGKGASYLLGKEEERRNATTSETKCVSAEVPVYSPWTLNMSHRSVKKESHWFTTILSGPELLKLECTWNTTGGPIKM